MRNEPESEKIRENLDQRRRAILPLRRIRLKPKILPKRRSRRLHKQTSTRVSAKRSSPRAGTTNGAWSQHRRAERVHDARISHRLWTQPNTGGSSSEEARRLRAKA